MKSRKSRSGDGSLCPNSVHQLQDRRSGQNSCYFKNICTIGNSTMSERAVNRGSHPTLFHREVVDWCAVSGHDWTEDANAFTKRFIQRGGEIIPFPPMHQFPFPCCLPHFCRSSLMSKPICHFAILPFHCLPFRQFAI